MSDRNDFLLKYFFIYGVSEEIKKELKKMDLMKKMALIQKFYHLFHLMEILNYLKF